jgi:hypothetical protein
MHPEQSVAIGFEVGASKRIAGRLWGQANYNYSFLDKDKTGVSSFQRVSVGVKYLWGRH